MSKNDSQKIRLGAFIILGTFLLMFAIYLIGNNKIKRRQEIETCYARNGAAIYITKIEKLDEYIMGGKILPYFMSKSDSFDIDDMEDWKIITGVMKK